MQIHEGLLSSSKKEILFGIVFRVGFWYQNKLDVKFFGNLLRYETSILFRIEKQE